MKDDQKNLNGNNKLTHKYELPLLVRLVLVLQLSLLVLLDNDDD